MVQRFFTFDAHILDVKDKDTLKMANHSMGIRLADTMDKANLVSLLQSAERQQGPALQSGPLFQGREKRGAPTSGPTDASTRVTSGEHVQRAAADVSQP